MIPIQLLLLSFSLKSNKPIREELITTPILTNGKTIELLMLPSAFKKNTREKKFGIPKITPQRTLFTFKGFLVLKDLPIKIKIPLILAIINNVIKNKYPPSLGNFCAKLLKIESEIPCPTNTKIINHKYFLSKLSLPPLVEDKYMPASAKKKAIPFNSSKVLFSGYKISAAQTGIIKDILFATVVTDIPTFCVPNA